MEEKNTNPKVSLSEEKKRAIVARLVERGEMITPEMLDDPTQLLKLLNTGDKEKSGVGKEDVEKERVGKEEEKRANETSEEQTSKEPKTNTPPVKILFNYNKPSKKRTYDDFVAYYRHRYDALGAMLRNRQELAGATSISRVLTKREQERVAIIGMITEKNLTKNKNIILKVEDRTGEITIIVSNSKHNLLTHANDLVLDEVIGIVGKGGGKTIFADSILHPDVPLARELKKSPNEEYMVLIGDPQVGGTEFLKEEFENLIKWLQGKIGTKAQKEIAKKVKYIIFTGDLVEGVGVYPGQEEELVIKDIVKQYEAFANYLTQLPEAVRIVVCPGNHDAGRIAEPQPPLYKDFAQALYDLPNVTVLSSPSLFTIGMTDTFPGFDILLYHGYSIPPLADAIPSIRNAGGQKATDKVMKFLLQRRHLAPPHGSNLSIPDADEDPLVINKVPDFFITGHVHRIATGSYRNITMINAGAWTDMTEDQEKRGLEPQPARLPIVNLKTRAVTIMNFYLDRKRYEKRQAMKEGAQKAKEVEENKSSKDQERNQERDQETGRGNGQELDRELDREKELEKKLEKEAAS